MLALAAASTLAVPLPAAGASPAAPAQAADPGAFAAFAAPLDRQADTGELAITPASLAYRSDVFEIALASGDEAGHEVERVLRAPAGAVVVYRWTVAGIDRPEEFHADLYGHEAPAPGFREASYRQGGGLSDSGAFTAPFDGYHGWFFKNDSAAPATVRLEVAGFYEVLSDAQQEALEQAIDALPPQ